MNKQASVKLTIYILVVLSLFQLSIHNNQANIELKGNYRLKYNPKSNKTKGWNYSLLCREELLTLNLDSSYIIERIFPQGGFEVLPDSGKWVFRNSMVILKSSSYNFTRKFKPTTNGLIEPKCKERNDLSNIIWLRE